MAGNARMSTPKKTRAEKAKEIAANPGAYKVCCGCNSIVAAKVNLCPNCHAYRFEEKPAIVVRTALELGSRAQQSVVPEDME